MEKTLSAITVDEFGVPLSELNHGTDALLDNEFRIESTKILEPGRVGPVEPEARLSANGMDLRSGWADTAWL